MDLGSREVLAQPSGLQRLAGAVVNPVAAVHHGFGDILAQHAADRNSAALANLFAAPDSVAQIQALAAAYRNRFLSDAPMRNARQASAYDRIEN